MFIRYEQIEVTDNVQTQTALLVPGRATHAQLQAQGGNIRYTMDNATTPTGDVGMLLIANTVYEFLVEDVKRIRFIRDTVATIYLGIHYSAGRNI